MEEVVREALVFSVKWAVKSLPEGEKVGGRRSVERGVEVWKNRKW